MIALPQVTTPKAIISPTTRLVVFLRSAPPVVLWINLGGNYLQTCLALDGGFIVSQDDLDKLASEECAHVETQRPTALSNFILRTPKRTPNRLKTIGMD
jgi:hypothetical protein